MASLVGGLGGSRGYGENALVRQDDSPSATIDVSAVFSGGLNFFGTTYKGFYLNNNGSITFGTSLSSYSPTSITAATSIPIIAPFWGDVDTRVDPSAPAPAADQVWYDFDTTNHVFTATWDAVGFYSQRTDKTNSFQLQLIAVGDKGDFDIRFIYQSIQWTTGNASGGKDGLGGQIAHAGYSAGTGKSTDYFELTESGTTAMLNLPGLGNVPGDSGVYLFEVRNGTVPLFTSAADIVDFNNLKDGQKASIVAGNDIYHGKGGGDTVTLPEPGNYNQVIGKDKDGNDIKLNWNDNATFFTESTPSGNSSVAAHAGNHIIVAGAGSDTITINGNGDNKITSGSGSTTVKIQSGGGDNTIIGGSGKADIDIQTTGGGKNTIAGSDGTTSIKVKTVGTSFSTITAGAGDTTIEVDSTNSSGGTSIKTGAGKTDITITTGKGGNSIDATASAGILALAIKEAGGNETNIIKLGAGPSTVTLSGVPTVPSTGDQIIVAGTGVADVTIHGSFLNTVVRSSAAQATPANFDLTIEESTTTTTLQGSETILFLRFDKDAGVRIDDNSVVKISTVASADGKSLDAGTIQIGAHATLEIRNEFNGTVNLGTGSSTLILDQPVGFGFNAKTATSQNLEFQLGTLANGDKIVLKGLTQLSSATLGDFKFADGKEHLILQLGGVGTIAVGSINGGNGDDNGAYFEVAPSPDKQDTVLTLKAGNNYDDALLGPQARAAQGVTGSGVKVGIISDSFANDRTRLAADLAGGVIPAVTVLNDQLDGYVFSGGLDEGRTMAGIVHAIAPGAQLYFYAPGGPFTFSSAVSALRAAGADIIVDDLGFTRAAEYLSTMNSTIDSAVRTGISYVTAAGNDRPSLPIYGHSANPNVIAVAAMNVLATPTAGANGGHYLPAATESFSSLGTNGKPDVTGVDGGQSTFPLGVNGLNPFYGTSAAAPSVAAVVALMLEANPFLRTRPKIVDRILEATAFPFGTNADAGAGLVQADRAVAMAAAAINSFIGSTSSPPDSANFSVEGALSPPAAPLSAALSIPVGSAGTGVTVMMLVDMGQAVTVSGLPSFTLNSGGSFAYDVDRSSPGRGKLLFDYTVGAADQATTLAITGFNGTIKDNAGNDADFSTLFGKATGLTINSTLTVASVGSSLTGVVLAGQTTELTITLNHGATLVSTGGAPTLSLTHGGIATFDAAKSNLTAGKLVFDYKIATGDATPSLTIASVDLPDGSTIKDATGNNADFALALDQTMGVQIGPAFVAGVLPQVEQTAIGAGQTVEVTIALSQGVVVDTSKGSPTLMLSNGATATYDKAASDPTKGLLVFDYKIGSGDQAAANLLVNKVALNGATVRDSGGIDVDLSGSQNAPTALTIGSPLTVSSTIASKLGALNLGETVQITLTMSKGLEVLDANAGGLSTFTMNDGGTAFFDSALSDPGAGKLVFDYTVVGSDQSVANLTMTQFNQNGGIYFDSKGNFADFSGALNVPLGLKVSVPNPAIVAIAAASTTKAEGASGTTAFTFTVTLSKTLTTAATMDWSVSGGDANSASTTDFVGGTMPAGSLSFAAGETTKTITVNVQGDTTVESNETFTVTLSHLSGSVALGTASAGGTIQNDDASVSIAATDVSKAEGNAGTTAFIFTLTRSDGSVAQTVAWSVAGSGANPAGASDFAGGTPPAGTVSFAAGETSRTIAVNVQGDTTVESNESFTVTLANPSAGLTIATANATGTIQNDDASVSIAAAAASKAEGNSGSTAFTFTVARSGSTSAVQSVAWSVTGSGANPATAADFTGGTLPTGSVTFAVGETSRIVTVNVQGDTTSEPNDSFTVTLASPSAGLVIVTASAGGTIQNDDAGPLIAHDDAYIALPGNKITVSAANGVVFNDEGTGITASLKTLPTHGGLQLAADGSLSYTPQFGFAGVDTFAYHATSGGNTVDGEVSLVIVPVSTSPTSTTLDLLALTSKQQIAATYAAFFGRAADAGGHAFWVGEFNRGQATQSPAQLFANIASSFGVSDEAKALYPFLANPFGASDGQISAFLDSVYNNLFNRSSDPLGLAYWTGQIKATLQAGQFVGSILVSIMGGAQDTADGKDITTLMGKVAVSLDYVHEQQLHNTVWAGASDTAAATNLLGAVTADPMTVLTGIKNAELLIANHA